MPLAETARGRLASLKASYVLFPMTILLLAGVFLVSPGLFIIDEFVLFAGAKAFLANGGFIVENGWSAFSSPDQKLWLLVAGPHGLTSQYPAGSAVVGGPLLGLFGMRGLMLPNVAAAIATPFVLWKLAEKHFGGKGVALASVLMLLGATFWLEYAYAVWPHAIGVLCVTLALLLILDILDSDARAGLKALAAGATIGVGFLFRTDTVLALPAIGLIALLFAKRPFHIGAFFGLGLAPFVALACAANYAKFGTINPLSYGKVGGDTTLSSHLAAVAALALVLLLLVAARFVKRPPRRREYVIGAIALALVVLLLPAARDFAWQYLVGAWALAVDATTIQDPRPGVEALPGGTLSFWGLWKKALGQSMPWLGLLFLIPYARRDDQLRRSLWIVLIFAGVWSLPFFMKSWHGGLGSNMRYLLPVIPVLCALSARLLIDFANPIANAPRILLVGGLAGVTAIALWAVFHPTGAGGAEQILSTWMLAAVAGMAILSGLRWRGQTIVRVVCLGAIGSGLAVSACLLAADFRHAQITRGFVEVMSRATADMPDRALVYAPSAFLSYWALEPGHIAALPGRYDGHGVWDDSFDYALIDQALDEGYRVLIWPKYVNDGLRGRYRQRLVRSGVIYPGGELLEVKAPAPDRDVGARRPGGSAR